MPDFIAKKKLFVYEKAKSNRTEVYAEPVEIYAEPIEIYAEPVEANLIAPKQNLIAPKSKLIAPKPKGSARLDFFFAQYHRISSR